MTEHASERIPRESDPEDRSAPEPSPSSSESGRKEAAVKKAPLDVEGLVRDAEAIRRLEEESAKRMADEERARQDVAGAFAHGDGVDAAASEGVAAAMASEKEEIGRKLRDEHGVDPAKGPRTFGERLRWMMSGDVRRLLERYREIGRAQKEAERRVRILRRAIKPETEEERARRQRTPPEARM